MSLDKTINTLVGGLVAVKTIETVGNMFDKTTKSTRRKKGSRAKSNNGFGTGLNLL